MLRRRKATVVKADKEEEEVNTDSLDLEKEEEGNISVGTSTGAIYLFSRQGALKLITPLQLLSCRCKRKCPIVHPPSYYELLCVGPLHTSVDLLHTITLWPDAWTTIGDLRKLPIL